MIKALYWALRQLPETVTANEKMVLIGLADMSNDEYCVNLSMIKLLRFTCLDNDVIKDCITSLLAKGFIKNLDENTDCEHMPYFKLLVTI